MAVNQGGRHYWFAENLKKQGYEPVIFCANTFHSDREPIDLGRKKYKVEIVDGIPFVYVKTKAYVGNGVSRVRNMLLFYKNLFPVAKSYAKRHGKPDVIIASSVHPLTMVAGIKSARRFGVPCICEVRDLWPESIIQFGGLSRDTVLMKTLFRGEQWIYENADRLIFTMEGGKDYIEDKGWSIGTGGVIDLNKVYHINNGVNLELFDASRIENPYTDDDLDDPNYFKFVYAGSIRKANNLERIVDAARYLPKESRIKIIIFGDGDERSLLEKKCVQEGISNIVFKGKVEKRFIPSIVGRADANILNYPNHDIWKYGGSQNKLFEYLAAGKPILSTIDMGYDIIDGHNAGIVLKEQDPATIARAMEGLASMASDEYTAMGLRARNVAQQYDFKVLTNKLIECIESV